jgi:Mor family transcriptional regulator
MPLVKINFIEREEIVNKYKDGVSTSALSEEYGCDVSSIYRILNKAGVPKKTLTFDGDLADRLRQEYEAGATSTTLAAKYNTTRARVCRYIREAGGTIR